MTLNWGGGAYRVSSTLRLTVLTLKPDDYTVSQQHLKTDKIYLPGNTLDSHFFLYMQKATAAPADIRGRCLLHGLSCTTGWANFFCLQSPITISVTIKDNWCYFHTNYAHPCIRHPIFKMIVRMVSVSFPVDIKSCLCPAPDSQPLVLAASSMLLAFHHTVNSRLLVPISRR